MKLANYFFYYSYVGIVILAGLWGAFINPAFDQRFLFKLDLNVLTDYTRINMFSQYRFLRAIEIGFGLFSFIFTNEIFSNKKFNLLFILIMALGIIARITSIIADGSPGTLMYSFLLYELVAWIVIIYYSSVTIYSTTNHVHT